MILDSLKLPDLTYEILEASDQIGGRLYTHNFSKPPAEHDYYDAGAMRFPDFKIMKRAFDLFEILCTHPIKYYLDPIEKDRAGRKSTVDGSEETPAMYNDICVISDGSEAPLDPHDVGKKPGGREMVPLEVLRGGVNGTLEEVFERFKKIMAEDFQKGFDALLEVDHMSTRQYLRERQNLDAYAIQWLETNTTSTGLFDQAFTESVIDFFNFAAKDKNGLGTWYCIEGGAAQVADLMEKKLVNGKVEKNKRVTRITQDKQTKELLVYVAGETKPRGPYITVFNTTSLGCLQRMDLTGLNLHPVQKDAIRSLHYVNSSKVAIKFKYPWWIKDCGIIRGGSGSTDLPLRSCVYPSYNLKDGLDKEATLLCSYTWAQDAIRIGSLIRSDSPASEDQLKELILDNLARLYLANFNKHSGCTRTLDEVRDLIANAYITHHAYSWSHDPFASGAVANFGPGQFRELYPFVTLPAADGRFYMLGEASSAHHAWVVGSLESAYAGVYKFLDNFDLSNKQEEMISIWGTIPEFKDELGPTGTVWLQVALGRDTEGLKSLLESWKSMSGSPQSSCLEGDRALTGSQCRIA